jgi:hypothetical protein
VIGLADENNLDFMKSVQIDGVMGLSRPNAKFIENSIDTLVTTYQK